ncbi:MAG: hypothetical protein P4K80_05405 [Acidobacteriaceae bacterium]|nr:hypothetical protein [Acidobacteriaceae bacterium]
MNWIRSVAREVYGLFVDDSSFAFAILCWIVAMAGLVRYHVLQRWAGPALFVGLALILTEGVLRVTRRKD